MVSDRVDEKACGLDRTAAYAGVAAIPGDNKRSSVGGEKHDSKV